jgi:hypothetical protein
MCDNVDDIRAQFRVCIAEFEKIAERDHTSRQLKDVMAPLVYPSAQFVCFIY